MNSVITQFTQFSLLFKTPVILELYDLHSSSGPTLPFSCCVPVEPPTLPAVFECYGRRVFPYSPPVPRRVRETGSEVYDTTRPPPPLAAVHGEERERRPREREGGAAKRERERGETRRRERRRREAARGERESRWLGLSVSGNSLQGFASKLLMRGKGGEGLLL
ncbi:hypothetical protein F2Q69_00028900 [Brassica cretica]|uniref:Uncharacterized protein n=1 Tax=Brassica cretica TaxID=69181 RepID=A0A8S9S4P3_BRACR|nr:hypothetical protein F2Q69_00028900 [Brassica cretica]